MMGQNRGEWKTLYWRNPKKNYAFEKIGVYHPRRKIANAAFLSLDPDNPLNLPGGLYTISQDNMIGVEMDA